MSSVIHETIVKDIVDLLSDSGDVLDKLSKDGLVKNGTSYKSLTRNANDLILVFPVLCTKGVSVETASMLSKAIEKNCVSLLQMLFASVQITTAEDLFDYISKFHKNISTGEKITIDDFMSLATEAVEEGKFEVIDKDLYNRFKQEMSNINNIAKVSLNESSLADFKCYRNLNSFETVLEAISNKPKNADNKSVKDNKFTEYITNNDIKKANELMPTKVFVNFNLKDGGQYTNAVIGVKCKLYPVDSLDIIERVASKYADTNWVRELVRASTGEISFWRDFVFALDKAKIDAINSSKKGSSAKMWKVLERRATKNRLSMWKANKADSSPITTLIMNQDEAEYLKKDYDINIENRNIAIKLMESYNLMGLVVVDEPAESASFIWDEGNNANYETLSFRSLERESGDSNYKKVINLMTKISR